MMLSTGSVKRHGMMVAALVVLGSSTKEKNKVKVASNGPTAAITRENSDRKSTRLNSSHSSVSRMPSSA